jgi:hypothetical protein
METDIREEIMELKIRKALCEHWDPKKAEMFDAAIQELTNIYENKTQTQRGESFGHTSNIIREIKE